MAKTRSSGSAFPYGKASAFLVVAAVVALGIWRMPTTSQGRSAGAEEVLADPAARPVEVWRAGTGEVVAFADSMARRSATVLAGLGVPLEAIQINRLPEQRNSTMRWEIVSDVPSDIPLPVCNLELTRMAARLGGTVLDGRQDLTGKRLSMLIGLEDARTDLVSLRRSDRLQRTKGRIALIVDDIGYQDRSLLLGFCNIKQPLTFSIFPNERESEWAADQANAAGHGVMVHLPMEPHDYPRWDPGEGAIFVDQPYDRVRELTRNALLAVPHAAGVNNHMGSRVTENRRVIEYVLEETKAQGFFFVDSVTSRLSVAYDAGMAMGLPVARNVQFVDLKEDEEAVRRGVRNLAWKARQYGTAVGIGHAKPKTLRVLKDLLPILEAEGFTFVTVAETVR